jgi:para-nitrobenzyl esterase
MKQLRQALVFLAALPFAFACANTSSGPGEPDLVGTYWQLVKFQGGDGTIETPDDRGKYIVAFVEGGVVNVRFDCNRGRGSWKSSGLSHIEFGPMAMTRAACPPGSLHDHLVKRWPYVRAYHIKDGNLFLALMADGGTYEFEAASK